MIQNATQQGDEAAGPAAGKAMPDQAGNAAAEAEVTSVRQLLQDLSQARDFPALSQIISKVNKIASSDSSRTEELTELILKDVALTNKLLRVVNSAFYKQRGGGPVSTVSRAILILGFDTVRDTALSLMLFDHLANHAQADTLKGEAVDSFYCGLLGRALARSTRLHDGEEALIAALFRNLGRMMCRLHFFEKSREVERLMAEPGTTEEAASRRVFGISYDDFGLAVGRHWGLPNSLLEGMMPLPAHARRLVGSQVPKLQVLSNLARDLYLATRDSRPEATREAYADLLRRYGDVVRLQTGDLEELVYQTSSVMAVEAEGMRIDMRSSPLLARLLGRRAELAGDEAAQEDSEAAAGGNPADWPMAAEREPANILIAGMQEVTALILDGAPVVDVLHVALELLYRSQCFDDVLICTIAANGTELVGRIGFGARMARHKSQFRIPVAFQADVFHAALSKNVDLLIEDSRADSIRNRIPDWYRDRVGARSFLLLPICQGQRPVALLYADRYEGPLQLGPQVLGLVKALRNQIALALRPK